MGLRGEPLLGLLFTWQSVPLLRCAHTHTHEETCPDTHIQSVCESLSQVRLFVTPWTVACQTPLSVHGDSPGKHPGAGCHAFLQGIFPTQGMNPGLPHCRSILFHLSHEGMPKHTSGQKGSRADKRLPDTRTLGPHSTSRMQTTSKHRAPPAGGQAWTHRHPPRLGQRAQGSSQEPLKGDGSAEEA